MKNLKDNSVMNTEDSTDYCTQNTNLSKERDLNVENASCYSTNEEYLADRHFAALTTSCIPHTTHVSATEGMYGVQNN